MATQAQVPQVPDRTLAVAPVARLRRPTVGMVVTTIVLLALVVVMVIPYLYMALSAFKVNSEIFSYPLTLWPRQWTWDNLSALVQKVPYGRWYVNTIVVAAVGTTLSVSLSSLAGFAFAKYDFRFKNVLFTIMLATLMIPFQVLLVPQFQIIKSFNWFNSYQALFVPSAVGAFGIFLMRQYTIGVPTELLDAGRIDGSSEFGLWWRVVLPLVRPGLAVLAILSFTSYWNDIFWPLIVTTQPSMFVINVGLASLIGPYDYQYGIQLCGALLASLPVIIVFLIFQRQFVEGLTQGAFKGA